MPATTLRFVKDAAYTVVTCPSAMWYFYYPDFNRSQWRCFLQDSDGSVISELGNGLQITADVQSCVPEAAGYHRAARLIREPTRLAILDFANDQTIEYLVPDPWRAGPAQWVQGAFYWIEWQADDDQSQTPARLMSAARDFLEPSQVGPDFDVSLFALGEWDDQFSAPDFTTEAAAIYLHHVSEQEFWVRVRFDLLTGAGSQGPETDGGPPSRQAPGWPLGSDLSLRLGHVGLETWVGGADSGYAPWNPGYFDDELVDMFLHEDRLYVSWGASTPVDPEAKPEGGFVPFHPKLGTPVGFCLA